MIIYESFLEKTPLFRKLLGGLSPPPSPPTPYGTVLRSDFFDYFHKYTVNTRYLELLVDRKKGYR